MKLVMDSSAFAKRYVREEGSEQTNKLLQEASQLAFSILVIPEIISALNRRARENALTVDEYQFIKTQFMQDIDDSILLGLNSEVITCSVKLLENNQLRAMDALHVACALKWNAELFATADKRQLKAAEYEGLAVKLIG
jgi:predicted nucleic acid-binding protein